MGLHDAPSASVEVHPEPGAPFVMAPDASQGLTEHVAAVSVPALHDDVPDAVYPASHVGWHVDQLARELVQSPTAPFVGAADASHGDPDTTGTGVVRSVVVPSPSRP